MGRDTLTKVLGDQVQVITFRNIQKWAIEKDDVLNQLTKIQIEKVIDNMKTANHKSGDIVFAKGSSCAQKIVVIIEGTLKKASKSDQVVGRKNEVYGSEFLKEGRQNQTFDDNIVMDGEGVLAELDFGKFYECLGGNYEQIMKKNEKSHEVRIVLMNESFKCLQ